MKNDLKERYESYNKIVSEFNTTLVKNTRIGLIIFISAILLTGMLCWYFKSK